MFFDSSAGIVGVFDGVGKGSESDKASGIAAQTAYGYLRHQPRVMDEPEALRVVGRALEMAHDDILSAELEGDETSTSGTVVKLFTTPNGTDSIAIGSIGDSRVYIVRDGQIAFHTLDTPHVLMLPYLLPEYGSIEQYQRTMAEVTDKKQLTELGQMLFSQRHAIGSALGQNLEKQGPAQITVQTVPLKEGDTVLVTSDGIHDNLTTDELQNLMQKYPARLLPERLVSEAQRRSRDHSHIRAKPDDMTVAVLSYYKKQ